MRGYRSRKKVLLVVGAGYGKQEKGISGGGIQKVGRRYYWGHTESKKKVLLGFIGSRKKII